MVSQIAHTHVCTLHIWKCLNLTFTLLFKGPPQKFGTKIWKYVPVLIPLSFIKMIIYSKTWENTSIWFWPFRPLLLIWTLSTLTFSTSLINLDSFNFELFDLLKFSLRMTSVQITRYFHFYALIVGLMLVGCWIWNKLIVSDKYHVLEVREAIL